MPLEQLLALYRRGSPGTSPASPQESPQPPAAPATAAACHGHALAQQDMDSEQLTVEPSQPEARPEAADPPQASALCQPAGIGPAGAPADQIATGTTALSSATTQASDSPAQHAAELTPALQAPLEQAEAPAGQKAHPADPAARKGALSAVLEGGSPKPPSRGPPGVPSGGMDQAMGVTSMEDAAALASSAQPTGYTLQTTNVHTKVWDPGRCTWQLHCHVQDRLCCNVEGTLVQREALCIMTEELVCGSNCTAPVSEDTQCTLAAIRGCCQSCRNGGLWRAVAIWLHAAAGHIHSANMHHSPPFCPCRHCSRKVLHTGQAAQGGHAGGRPSHSDT